MCWMIELVLRSFYLIVEDGEIERKKRGGRSVHHLMLCCFDLQGYYLEVPLGLISPGGTNKGPDLSFKK